MEIRIGGWKSKLRNALIIFLASCIAFFFIDGFLIWVYTTKNVFPSESASLNSSVSLNPFAFYVDFFMNNSEDESQLSDADADSRLNSGAFDLSKSSDAENYNDGTTKESQMINYTDSNGFNFSKFIVKNEKSGLGLLNPSNDVAKWKRRTFLPAGVPSFTQYSAYRMGPSRIRIIGITVHSLKRKFHYGKCHWHGKNGKVISGDLTWENDNQTPQTLGSEMFECLLHKPTGNGGGYLKGTIDTVESVLYEEGPGELQDKLTPFPYTSTYCLAPMHGDVDGKSLHEWMEYHRVIMDAEYFVFYNIDALNNEILSYLKPYMQRNMAEVIEFGDVMPYKLWYYGQVLASWDCAAYMAFKTKWIFLHDIDEYLQTVRPHDIHYWLKKYHNVAWLTHGSFQWNISLCKDVDNVANKDSAFQVERMVFRRKNHYCFVQPKSGPCLGWHGHRKLIFNPRKCTIVETHMVINPPNDGYHFKLSEVRNHHYRHLSVKRSKSFRCKIIPKRLSDYPSYNLLYNIAMLARKARNKPLVPRKT